MTKSAMATPGLVLGHVSTVKMEGSCNRDMHHMTSAKSCDREVWPGVVGWGLVLTA